MTLRVWCILTLVAAIVFASGDTPRVTACCPSPRAGQTVINADQTVIIIWDAATQTEHFIRKASFKTDGDDFGFLIPSPSQPELSESGEDTFSFLQQLTEPEIKSGPGLNVPFGCGFTSSVSRGDASLHVQVLEEKLVAGFNATVLAADSADELVQWLREHGYPYSSEVEAWARPYVERGWKITALKVPKDGSAAGNRTVAATALRMSFKTDRPLFPYREPDYKDSPRTLGTTNRLLRIYFIAEAKYRGELTTATAWTGKIVWANRLSAADRTKALEFLKLPAAAGPKDWWLTEFEDNWPYRVARADLYFVRAADQRTVKRAPILAHSPERFLQDGSVYALAAVVLAPLLMRRRRRRD